MVVIIDTIIDYVLDVLGIQMDIVNVEETLL